MIYEVSKDFVQIEEASGTIQNTSRIHTLELSDTDEPNSGILIYPLQKVSFNDIPAFIRCIDGSARAYVVPFGFGDEGTGGSGSSYVLPIATKYALGGVRVGEGLTINPANGILNCTATGGSSYTLPTASPSTKGGIKVGTGLSMAGETLNCIVQGGETYSLVDKDNQIDGLMWWQDKAKLDTLESGELNKIESITIDGHIQNVTNKNADLDLSAYAKKKDITRVFRYKGTVIWTSQLPTTGQEVGDVYNVRMSDNIGILNQDLNPGDNVVWTGSDWDVLAGIYDYILEPATTTKLGGIIVGEGLGIDATGLLNVTINGGKGYENFIGATQWRGGYSGLVPAPIAGDQDKFLCANGNWATVPSAFEPATTTKLGGVIVGNGLEVKSNGLLNVTLEAGKYSEFTGATATTGGTSGLVIKPNAGDDDKFLRGDGTWAVANTTVINMGGSATIIDTKVPAIQGALWQDVIDGTPCLKLRYDDYEYNFYYDTINLVGNVTPSLDSSAGMVYTLGTAPSTVDGGLWYEVESDKPVLKIHDGNYNYGYLYDTITYKGGNTDLLSYMPFNSSADDAISHFPWGISGTPTIGINPILNDANSFGGRAFLGNSGTLSFTVPNKDEELFVLPLTIDFWFCADYTTAPSSSITIFRKIFSTTGGSYIHYDLRATSQGFELYRDKSTSMLITDYILPNQRNHFALVADDHLIKYFINGRCVSTYTKVVNVNQGSTGNLVLGYTNNTFAVYIDHFRIHDKILWDGDFTPPVASDYL